MLGHGQRGTNRHSTNLRVVEVGIGHVACFGIHRIVAVAHAPFGEGVGTKERAETSRREGVGARPGSGVAFRRRVEELAALSVGGALNSCLGCAEKEQNKDGPDYHTRGCFG